MMKLIMKKHFKKKMFAFSLASIAICALFCFSTIAEAQNGSNFKYEIELGNYRSPNMKQFSTVAHIGTLKTDFVKDDIYRVYLGSYSETTVVPALNKVKERGFSNAVVVQKGMASPNKTVSELPGSQQVVSATTTTATTNPTARASTVYNNGKVINRYTAPSNPNGIGGPNGVSTVASVPTTMPKESGAATSAVPAPAPSTEVYYTTANPVQQTPVQGVVQQQQAPVYYTTPAPATQPQVYYTNPNPATVAQQNAGAYYAVAPQQQVQYYNAPAAKTYPVNGYYHTGRALHGTERVMYYTPPADNQAAQAQKVYYMAGNDNVNAVTANPNNLVPGTVTYQQPTAYRPATAAATQPQYVQQNTYNYQQAQPAVNRLPQLALNVDASSTQREVMISLSSTAQQNLNLGLFTANGTRIADVFTGLVAANQPYTRVLNLSRLQGGSYYLQLIDAYKQVLNKPINIQN